MSGQIRKATSERSVSIVENDASYQELTTAHQSLQRNTNSVDASRRSSSNFDGARQTCSIDLSVRKFLEEHVLFRDLHDEDFVSTVAALMTTRVYSDGSYVIRQGEVGRAMFFVLKGEVEVVSEDGETVINIMKEESFFGEIGVLFSVPRTATCRASGRCILLLLTKDALKKAVQGHPEVAVTIRQIAEERFASYMKQKESSMHMEFGQELKLGITQNDLKKIPLFRDCEVGFLHMLALTLSPLQFFMGDIIIRKADVAREMYFVVRGAAEVFNEEDGTTFAEFYPGSFFGEVGLFFQIKRTASVRCISNHIAVFRLTKEDMDSVLKRYPEVAEKINEEAKARFQYNQEREKAKLSKRQQMQTEVEVVRERLKQVPLFRDASLAFLHELALGLKLNVYEAGSLIIRKDEVGKSMFFVVDGVAEVISEDQKAVYADLNANSFFGEVALFFEINRTATVRSRTRTTMYELSKEALEKVLEQHLELKETMAARAEENFRLFRNRQKAVEEISEQTTADAFGIEATASRLKQVPIFKKCDEGFLRTVALGTSVRQAKRNELIVHKGETSSEMFFIVRGLVQIISEDGLKVYDSVSDGGFFGEVGLLRGIPRTASVRVASPRCDIMVLSADALQNVFQQYPESYQNIVLEADKRFRLTEQRKIATEAALHDRAEELAGKSKDLWDSAAASLKRGLRRKKKDRAVEKDESQPKRVLSFENIFKRNKKENKIRSKTEVEPVNSKAQEAEITSAPSAIGNEAPRMPAGRETSNHIPEKVMIVPARSLVNALTLEHQSVSKISKIIHVLSPSRKRKEERAKVAPASRRASIQRGRASVASSNLTATSRRGSVSGSRTRMYCIMDLEDQELRIVMSCLNPLERLRMRLTCKRWNESLRNPMYWDTLDFAPLYSEATRKTFTSFWELSSEHLVGVRLDTCWKIGDQDLQALATLCPNLSYISLSNCWKFTDTGLFCLAQNLPRMIEVDLSYCGQIRGAGFANHKWKRLKKLDISYCKQIGDDQIDKILSRTTDITELKFRRCMKMTDLAIFYVVRYCRNLRALELSDCDKLTDRCLKWLASSCANLTSLNLTFCIRLTNAGIHELSIGTPLLEHLDLSFCGHVTDAAVGFLADTMPDLRYLSLRGCKKITDAASKHLGRAGCKLKVVNLTICPNVTAKSKDMLEGSIPGVKVLLDQPRMEPVKRRATEATLNEVFLNGPADKMRKTESPQANSRIKNGSRSPRRQ